MWSYLAIFIAAFIEGEIDTTFTNKAGETVTTKLKIPQESDNEDFRGKELDLSLEIAAVEHRKLPEMTREFLDRIARGETLHDDALFNCYLVARGGELHSFFCELQQELERRGRTIE